MHVALLGYQILPQIDKAITFFSRYLKKFNTMMCFISIVISLYLNVCVQQMFCESAFHGGLCIMGKLSVTSNLCKH